MIRLRPAALSDAPDIARVYVATWRDAYAGILPSDMLVRMSEARHAGQWRATLLRPRRRETMTVAIAGNAVVGFGTAGPARGAWPAHTGEVHTLYVLPDHQNGGTGRALLRTLFADLRRHGMTAAAIWVVAENPARFFYEAMGGALRARRAERMWGAEINTQAYLWDDLDAAIARLDSGLARTRG
jgi:GNAT superfamily N-acetyltransferase